MAARKKWAWLRLRLVTSQGSPYPSRSPRAHPSGWTMDMLVAAYGTRISKKTLKELLDKKWFQLDHVVAATMDEPNNFFETCSVPDPEGAFNCPGASPSPLHAIDATLPQDSFRLTGRAPRSS